MEQDALRYLTEHLSLEEIRKLRERNGFTVEELAGAVRQMIARGDPLHDEDEAFETFEPFEPPDTSKLPTFPVDKLPPVLKHMAKAAAENLQVAVDMTAVAGLVIASLCIQKKFIICPKAGWYEPLNLYAAIVARPSDRKSPAMTVMSRPLYTFEKAENERRAPLVEQYRTRKSVLEKRIVNLKEQTAKPGKTIDAAMDEITELQTELSDLEREAVKPLRLLAENTTSEALAALMAANGGKMGILSDEGGLFDVIAGRYSSGKVNMDVFLKAYSGVHLRIDRIGRKQEIIDHPALTMLLMVQPIVLETIMSNNDFAGRGFLARFLYSLPVSTVGHRTYDSPPIPCKIETAYGLMLHELLSIPESEKPSVIKVSPEAHQEAKRFAEELEPRLAEELGDLDDLEAWAGKYHGQIMRLAGVLHCCQRFQNAADVPVSLEIMQAAEKIGGYFLEHARAAFQVMGLTDDTATKDAKYILKRLGDRMEITKRGLFQLCKGKIRKVDDLESGLKVLIDRGYIVVNSISTGGRPTEKIMVNPQSQKYQNPQKSA